MIRVNVPLLGDRERELVLECLESTWISGRGPYVTRFEEMFAGYCGMRYGVSTPTGTTALHLALATLGIGPGDEVIMPALTIASCAFAIAYTGARPVLVDSEPVTGNLDPAQVEAKVTPQTRAIMPVHLYGHPVDMDPVLDIARRHALHVVEDAAEAHGALYRGRVAGGMGTIGCFSFYANKLVTTGEGGMMVTSDPALAEHADRLKELAHVPGHRFLHDEIGFNYQMTNLQAALGIAQLERIDEAIAKKRWMADQYAAQLADVPGLLLPTEAPWARSVYWMYAVRVTEESSLSRDEVMAALRERGVDTRTFFVPMHQQPVFERLGWFAGERYPVAEALSETGFYLPSGLAITADQIQAVCEAVRDVMGLR
ncbi:MAG: DegT/DnrJ/EryC1/StrS family aminotransferase [Chloroflexi bacterium]|nr:DegT/DnrJ/EryC1/StrS family aminotransferase [Chloroflexota bacterium]MBU1748570.1 DegT/DnrJ/EryC1/StrS family aminotransferase [Chloroflexota bacterium]MBU1879861.1 DegT/DnrJ/EryC1/StrS family aminotransferase [Chloroflexota bacterium]